MDYGIIRQNFIFSGMRKEWIRSEEEKQTKRLQLQRNRRSKNSQKKNQVSNFFFFFSNKFLFLHLDSNYSPIYTFN
jgi:hypothetical protein